MSALALTGAVFGVWLLIGVVLSMRAGQRDAVANGQDGVWGAIVGVCVALPLDWVVFGGLAMLAAVLGVA